MFVIVISNHYAKNNIFQLKLEPSLIWKSQIILWCNIQIIHKLYEFLNDRLFYSSPF